MKPDEPTCAKCRHLLTESGIAVCRLDARPLKPCADYRDVSYHKPPLTGGLTGMLVWPRR